MGAQHVARPPRETAEPTYGNLILAVILGILAVLSLVLAISAPWWLARDLETLGIDAYLSQSSTLMSIGVTLWMFAVPS